MNEKQIQIVEAAMKCFAQKGYHATTMQVIADSLGIAKGSLYFYFKSKEDVLISAFTYYQSEMKREILSVTRDLRLSPREILRRQLMLQMEQFLKHSDFIQMMFGEQVFQINEDMKKFMIKLKAGAFYWYYNRILAIYGTEVKRYALDAAAMMEAIVKEFIGALIFQRRDFDKEQVSQFLMNRLDDLVQGMMARQDSPVHTMESLGEFLCLGAMEDEGAPSQAGQELVRMESCIANLQLNEALRVELQECYQALLQEWSRPIRSKVIIKGLLAYMRSFNQASIKDSLELLEHEIVE